MVRFAISAAAFATTAKSALVELAPNGLDHSKVTLMMHVTAIQHRKLNFAHSLITCYTSLGLSTSVRYLLWSSGVGIWRDSTINRQHVYSFNYLTSRNAILCAQLRTNVNCHCNVHRDTVRLRSCVSKTPWSATQERRTYTVTDKRQVTHRFRNHEQTHHYRMSPIQWVGVLSKSFIFKRRLFLG